MTGTNIMVPSLFEPLKFKCKRKSNQISIPKQGDQSRHLLAPVSVDAALLQASSISEQLFQMMAKR